MLDGRVIARTVAVRGDPQDLTLVEIDGNKPAVWRLEMGSARTLQPGLSRGRASSSIHTGRRGPGRMIHARRSGSWP